MTRRLLLTFILAATATCAPVAAADAATKRAPYPTVTKVEPLTAGIGEKLKISGKNFVAGANKNTVVFKRDGKKAIFVKAYSASKSTLWVVIPDKFESALGQRAGAAIPTTFRIRVLSKRFGKGYTALKASPRIGPKTNAVVAEEAKKAGDVAAAATAAAAAAITQQAPPPPPDCDADGISDVNDPMDDADGLTDVVEDQIKTDRCKADTDGDGLEDGWEYKSAFDLNRHSCPSSEYPVACTAIPLAKYPVKKPYPNPLDASDAGTDHDGDWLNAAQEHDAWRRKVGRVRKLDEPLWYSDGLQASIDDPGTVGCRGMVVPPVLGSAALYGGDEYEIYSLDHFGRASHDGCLNDGERDEDDDFLSNVVETSAALSGGDWWSGVFEEPLFQVQFEGTHWLDQDSDGDDIVDGKDDQDHDDFWNLEEVYRGDPAVNAEGDLVSNGTGLWVDAFNPCLPSPRSRTCPPVIPMSGEVWRPFRDPKAGEAPLPRWPLYDNYDGPQRERRVYVDVEEDWLGMPLAQQTMPPVHPLPRCFDEDFPPVC